MQGILFDNDGTLIDTHDLILSSMRHATETVLGMDLPEERLMAKVGQPLAIQVKDFTADPWEQEEWLRVYREHNHAHHDDAIRAFPGIREALEALSDRGIVMGVVTSKMHALAWRGLELCGLAPYLDCCIGADDCTRFKPDPQPVTLGLAALDLPGNRCFYVGDSPFDLEAGRGAGCRTVAVTWGMFPEDVLLVQSPDLICHYPQELTAL